MKKFIWGFLKFVDATLDGTNPLSVTCNWTIPGRKGLLIDGYKVLCVGFSH